MAVTGRRRGRPKKLRPVVSDSAVCAVKQMLRTREGKSDYQIAKDRCYIMPRKRPTLMRKLKLNLSRYEETGNIEYDRDLAALIHKDDRNFIETYERSMYVVWLLEHGVASIRDERTRAIAKDTLLKGKRVQDLPGKYGIGAHAIWMRKREAIDWIAVFYVSRF